MPTTTSQSVGSVVQTLQSAVSNTTTNIVANAAANAYFSHLIFFQIISVILTVAFITGCVIIVREIGWLRIRLDRFNDVVLHTDSSKARAQTSWDDIEQHFFAGSDNDLRIAIINADTLLDDVLRKAGVGGMDLGEKLRKVKITQLPNLEDIWQAHKIRNRIAHEPNFSLKRDLAEKVLTIYETAFVHLGVLEKQDDLSKANPTDPTEPDSHPPQSH